MIWPADERTNTSEMCVLPTSKNLAYYDDRYNRKRSLFTYHKRYILYRMNMLEANAYCTTVLCLLQQLVQIQEINVYFHANFFLFRNSRNKLIFFLFACICPLWVVFVFFSSCILFFISFSLRCALQSCSFTVHTTNLSVIGLRIHFLYSLIVRWCVRVRERVVCTANVISFVSIERQRGHFCILLLILFSGCGVYVVYMLLFNAKQLLCVITDWNAVYAVDSR